MQTSISPAMTSEIRTFLKKLLVDAGQTDLGDELESILISDLYSRLVDRLLLTAMAELSEEKQDELAKLAEQKASAGTIEHFLKKNVPGYLQVFADALEDFRNTYISASKDQE